DHVERTSKGGSDLHGAGLFPDRIIFSSPHDGDLQKTQKIVLKVIESLAQDIRAIQNVEDRTFQEKAKEYLLDYLNVHIIEKELDATQNPILALSPALDALELRQGFPALSKNYLTRYLTQASVAKNPTSDLALDAFGENRLLNRKTIEHLAVAQFINPQTDEYTDAAMEDTKSCDIIKKYSTHPDFIQAHKYVAIVQADGDNIGKTISQLKKGDNFSQEMAQVFSRILMDFSTYAVQQVNDYGGLPVYAGGDDLLFFAPVLNKNTSLKQQNIFALLKQLDTVFRERMETGMTQAGLVYGEDLPVPTLSFGLSISYYKFPLYESLSSALNLLFGVAKQKGKHSIAFELRKHAGSSYKGILPLKGNLSGAYSDLLINLFEEDHTMLLSSVAQKLRRERHLVDIIGKEDDRVRAYMANSFNESIHQKGHKHRFISSIASLIPEVYKTHPIPAKPETLKEQDPAFPHNQLLGLLRSLQFLVDDTTA
ncbi:MAG: type III-B CRISPR-associated protein Cas10/Cmr2, partial [Bacteroidota bacterium]